MNNMKKLLFTLCAATFFLVAPAQTDDPIVMTVNGVDVTRSEFEYSYNKNNTDLVVDKKSLDEYVDLFVNYKLKVAAAMDAQLDTTAAFQKEVADYRSQQAEVQDNEELIKREAELFPERTPIVLNGMFTRNGTTGAVTTFYVDEIVHANEEQFDEICRGDDSEILKQYNEKTYDPITDGVHGILVIGPKGDGVMVDTSGYDYARYMSYAPKIEMPVNYILEQNMKRDAIYEMKVYVPLKVTRYDEDFEEEEIDGF